MLGRATAVNENPEDVSAEALSSAWMGLAGSAHAFAMPWRSLQMAAESLFSGQLESAGISGQMQGQLHSAVTRQDQSACLSLLPGMRASGDLSRAAPGGRHSSRVSVWVPSSLPTLLLLLCFPSVLLFSLPLKVKVSQLCPTVFDPMDIQSVEFSRLEYWSG